MSCLSAVSARRHTYHHYRVAGGGMALSWHNQLCRGDPVNMWPPWPLSVALDLNLSPLIRF